MHRAMHILTADCSVRVVKVSDNEGERIEASVRGTAHVLIDRDRYSPRDEREALVCGPLRFVVEECETEVIRSLRVMLEDGNNCPHLALSILGGLGPSLQVVQGAELVLRATVAFVPFFVPKLSRASLAAFCSIAAASNPSATSKVPSWLPPPLAPPITSRTATGRSESATISSLYSRLEDSCVRRYFKDLRRERGLLSAEEGDGKARVGSVKWARRRLEEGVDAAGGGGGTPTSSQAGFPSLFGIRGLLESIACFLDAVDLCAVSASCVALRYGVRDIVPGLRKLKLWPHQVRPSIHPFQSISVLASSV